MLNRILAVPRMTIRSLLDNDKWTEVSLNHIHRNRNEPELWALISINGSNEKLLTQEEMQALDLRFGCRMVFSCRFDDVDGYKLEELKQRGIATDYFNVFNDFDAKSILQFVDTVVEYGIKNLIIHCYAGISRSGAIGSVIAFNQGIKHSEFMKINPNIYPNKYIVDLMLNELPEDSKIAQQHFKDWQS